MLRILNHRFRKNTRINQDKNAPTYSQVVNNFGLPGSPAGGFVKKNFKLFQEWV